MALLRSPEGALHVIAAFHRIGRDPSCKTCIGDKRVSGEHAVIQWRKDRWCVRDLGSRNGTWVDERRRSSREWVALVAGSRLAFGDPDRTWIVADVAPPAVAAQDPHTGAVIQGDASGLELAPEVRVTRGAGGWRIELHDQARPLVDGERVDVGDRSWRIWLPVGLPGTAAGSEWEPSLHELSLEVAVARDQEHLEVRVRSGAHEVLLSPRTIHETLRVLARQRLEDARGGDPEPEQGWLHVDELVVLANRRRRGTVEMDLRRIRQELTSVTGARPGDVIERRRGTGLVRLGIRRVVIRDLV